MDLKKQQGDFLISTVSLPEGYEFDGKYPMGKFETMIKNTRTDSWLDFQERYDFEEDAINGHREAIRLVMEGKLID